MSQNQGHPGQKRQIKIQTNLSGKTKIEQKYWHALTGKCQNKNRRKIVPLRSNLPKLKYSAISSNNPGNPVNPENQVYMPLTNLLINRKTKTTDRPKRTMNVGSFICSMMVVAQVLGSVFGFGSVSVQDLFNIKPAHAAEGIARVINYQGRLMDSAGEDVANGNYNMIFVIYDSETAGNQLWSASTTNGLPTGTTSTVSVAVKNGLFTILLGDESTGQVAFPEHLFNIDDLYLGITVGSDSEMIPRKRLSAVPYAFNTETLQGQYASGTSLGSDANLFALNQASSSNAYTTRTALYIETKGNSNLLDFLIRANNSSADVFTITRQGNVTTTGNLQVLGSTIFGSASSSPAVFNSYINSDFLPYLDNTYSLGSASYRWKNLYATNVSTTNIDALNYVSTTNLYINGSPLSLTGYFVQNGNSFGAGAVLGTNDNNSLSFETNNITRMTLSTTGQLALSGPQDIGVNASGYKLYISEYDNDDATYTYPIYAIDENGTVDFYLRSRSTAAGNSFAFFQGDVQIGNTLNFADHTLTITGLGDAGINLNADSNNSTETDNPFVYFTQDGGTEAAIMGLTGGTNVDPRNVAYTGAIDNSFLIGHKNASPLQIGTNNTVRLTINASGMVGLGTNDPQFPLAISKTAVNKDVLLIQETTGGVGNSAGIAFKTNGGNGTDSIMARIRAYDQNNWNSDIIFEVSGDSVQNTITSEAMRITYNGRVGIGDTTPASMFTVGNGDLFQVDSTGNIVKIRNITYSFPASQGGVNTYLTNDGSGNLTWQTNPGTMATPTWQDVTDSGAETTHWIAFAGASSTGNVNPGEHNQFDLGTYYSAWRNLYVSSTAYINSVNTNQLTFNNVSTTNIDVSNYASTTNLYAINAYITNATTTNIYNSGTVSTTNLYVNGVQVTGIESQDLQDVTDIGAVTTNWIQFAGATSTGHILPTSTLSYDLGSTSNRWRDVWASSTRIGTSTWELWQSNEGFTISTNNLADKYLILSHVGSLLPGLHDTQDIGSASSAWRNIYVSNQIYGNSMEITPDSNWLTIVTSTTIATTGALRGIDVVGDYAYITDFNYAELHIYDVSNVESPKYVSSIDLSIGYAPWDSLGTVKVQGNYAYVYFSSGELGGYYNMYVVIVDVSDPSNPVKVSQSASITTGNPSYDLDVQGNYVYVADNQDSQLEIIDVTNPSSPVRVKRVSVTAPGSVVISGNYAYTIPEQTANDPISIIDISDPPNAFLVGTVNSMSTGWPIDLAVSKNSLFVHDQNELIALDISSPSAPVLKDDLAKTAAQTRRTSSIVAAGDYVYTFAGTYLSVFDVSDTSNLVLAAQLSIGATPWSLEVEGGYAYVIDSSRKLHIIDLSGIKTHTLNAHSANFNNLSVGDSATFADDVSIGGQLTVGKPGIYNQGILDVLGASRFYSTSTFADIAVEGMVNSNLLPYTNLAYDLGSTSYRWKDLWASSTRIGTSTWEIWQSNTGLTFSRNNLANKYLTVSNAGHLLPAANNTQDIGSASRHWRNIYASGTAYLANLNLSGSFTQNFAPDTVLDAYGPVAMGGTGYDVALQGRYAYVNRGTTNFQIYDLTNPLSPTLLSQISYTTSGATHIEVQSNYAYSVGDNEFYVVDISNPGVPVSIYEGTLFAATANDLKVRSHYAYVAEGAPGGGLNIIDITEPANPVIIKKFTLSTDSEWSHIYVDGSYAYLVSNADNRFAIVDVTDPFNPVERYNNTTDISAPNEIIVKGRYAYIGCTESLRIFDVSNSSAPVLAKTVSNPGYSPTGLRIGGDYVYSVQGTGRYSIFNVKDAANAFLISQQQISAVADNLVAIDVTGKYAVLIGGTNLRTLDLKGAELTSLLAHSAEVGSLNVLTNATINNNLTVRGGLNVGIGGIYTNGPLTAYATSSFMGRVGIGTITPNNFRLQVAGDIGPNANISYDLGSSTYNWRNTYSEKLTVLPSQLQLLSTITGAGDIRNIEVQGQYMYVLDNFNSLKIYDIQNPSYPRLIGSLALAGDPYTLVVKGDYAYLPRFNSAGLHVVDVSDRGNPVLRQTLTVGVPTYSYDAYATDKYLFVSNMGSDNVAIFNIENPTNVSLIGATPSLGGNTRGLAVQGKFLYASENGTDSLHIYDVSNPASPVFKGSVDLGGSDITDVVVSGNYAYVADAVKISIVDISKPATPSIVGTYTVSGVDSLYIAGNYLYGGNSSVYIFDVSSSTAPALVTSAAIACMMYDIEVSGRILYAGCTNADQVRIYDIQGAYINGLAANSASIGSLQVMTDARINNTLDVSGGLTVGNRGIYTNGSLSVLTTSTLLGSVGIGTSYPNNFKLQVAGDIGPNTDDTYSLGSATYRFKDAYFSGTVDTKPMNLARNGGYNLTTNFVYSLAVSDNKAYVGTLDDNFSGQSQDFQIYDVTDPASPVFISGINVGTSAVTRVVVAGKYAYIGTRNATVNSEEFQIYDISNPSAPVRVGGVNLSADYVYAIAISGKYAFLGTLTGASNHEFFIYDISSPASPSLVSSVDIGANIIRDIEVHDNLVYIGTLTGPSNQELLVYDINNITSPVYVGGADVGAATINDLQIVGKYAYIGTLNATVNSEELQIYDISSSTNITRVGGVALGANALMALQVVGNYAYLGTLNVTSPLNHDLLVYDISNPASPSLVDSLDVGASSIRDIVSSGRYIYTGVQNATLGGAAEDLQIFDVGGITTPNAFIGSAQIDDLRLRGNGYFDNNLTIRNSLNVGMGGIYSNGPLSVMSTTTLSDLSISGRVNSDWLPYIDNTYDLGSATYRWRNLHAVNATFTTLYVSSGIQTNAFIQEGNSFTATAILGTNDNYDLNFEANDNTWLILDTAGNFYPTSTNAQDLGATGYRWANVWGVTYHVGDSTWEIEQNASDNFIISNTGTDYVKLDQSNLRGTFVGRTAGNSNAGAFNSAFGDRALYTNATGQSNSAFGSNAGYELISGDYNTAVGYYSLHSNQTGSNNTAVGSFALQGLNGYSNSNNTAIGFQSLYTNATGTYNTAIGVNALYNNLGGASNTAIGYESLYSNTIGVFNLAIGNKALYSNTIGEDNFAIGAEALYSNVNGDDNLAIGYLSSYSNVDGSANIAIGPSALLYNVTGDQNIAIGSEALWLNTVDYNLAIGTYAMRQNTTGSYNTAIGEGSARRNETGIYNVSLGHYSLYGSAGQSNSYNTALGSESMLSVQTGASNTAVGYRSLYANTTGYLNTAVGNLSLSSNTTGYSNVAMGNRALQNATTSDFAIAIGNEAARDNYVDGIIAIGRGALMNNNYSQNNVGIGEYALSLNSTGNNNTAIGKYAGLDLESNNNTALGAAALFGGISNASGRANTAIGLSSIQQITTGSTNTAVGIFSLTNNSSGSYNSSLGGEALYNNTTGNSNTAVGMQALYSNQTGSYNIGLGAGALYSNTTSSNLAIGNGAAYSITTGGYNISIGQSSMTGNQTGIYNTLIGYKSGQGVFGQNNSFNTGLGALSLNSVTTGSGNTALGGATLQANTTGQYNTAVGYIALGDNTTGRNNTAVGVAAIRYNSTGYYNTGVGHSALAGTIGSAFWYNSALGANALESLTTGASNTAVGYGAMEDTTTGYQNVAIGNLAMNKNLTGSGNIAIGDKALLNATSSLQNVAVGNNTLRSNQSGSYNAAFGDGALYSNTHGANNVGLGGGALFYNTTGNRNLAAGYGSLLSNTTGSENVGLGYFALYGNQTGQYNTAVGYNAGYDANNGNYSTMIGYESGYANDTGDYSTAVGASSLRQNISGQFNTAIGYASLQNVTSSNYNTAVGGYSLNSLRSYVTVQNTALGYNALRDTTDGTQNTAAGMNSLRNTTVGSDNTALGHYSAYTNSDGNENSALGSEALYFNSTGDNNTAIGYRALYGQSGNSHSQNTAVGSNSMTVITVGFNNSAVGSYAMRSLTNGSYNSAMGVNSMYNIVGGGQNSALGYDAGYYMNAGDYNVAVGYRAFVGSSGNSSSYNTVVGSEALDSTGSGANYNTAIGYQALDEVTTGDNNTGVGYNAGTNITTGGNNTFLGYGAGASGNYTNAMALGYNASVTADNRVQIGNTSVAEVYFGGSSGDTDVYYYGELQDLSDSRSKTDVVNNDLGLDFINLLRPVHFTMIDSGHRGDGLIAQEVESAALSLGKEFNGVFAPDSPDEYYTVAYLSFIGPLITSVQELYASSSPLFSGIDINPNFTSLGESFLSVDTDGNLAYKGATVKAQNIASSSTQAFGSYTFSFMGSAWNTETSQEITTSFRLQNNTISATSSEFNLVFATGSAFGQSILTITDLGDVKTTGDLYVGKRLFLGSKTTGGSSTSTYIFVDDTLGASSTYIATNADGWQADTSYDYAERYQSSDLLEPGDLVTADKEGTNKVKRSTSSEDIILGIVSTKPGFITGGPAPDAYPIALAGRVPTKVSTLNGAIQVGDFLSPSDIPGVAVKSTGQGSVIGIALESYDLPQEGLISVFVNMDYMGNKFASNDSFESSKDIKGFAFMQAGSQEVRVTHESVLAYPIIQLFPQGYINGSYSVKDITASGFTIKFSNPQDLDIKISYIVTVPNVGSLHFSDGTIGALDSEYGEPIGPTLEDLIITNEPEAEEPTETVVSDPEQATSSTTMVSSTDTQESDTTVSSVEPVNDGDTVVSGI